MPSERVQRQLDRILDEAEAALGASNWPEVRRLAADALRLEPENEDARTFLDAAERDAPLTPVAAPASRTTTIEHPSSFVAGRYRVVRFLGEGGKKRVFLAHDERLDRDVAFAVIKTEGLDDVGHERIVREAQAMGRMGAHPHIVGIYEIGEEQGVPYVVTELLGGGDVEELLASEGGPLPLARALAIAKDVARGLAFAHQQGVVHRDLKPGNVWLTPSTGSGQAEIAKIGDFGLAVALDRSRLTTHGLMVGTVAYMPPEQALGGEVTPQADLYSLGAMLYELVTGKPPFAGDSPTAIISQHINTPPVAPSWHSEHCPPDLEALILKLLAKVPAERPASAVEVLAALEAVDPEAPSVRHSDSSANPLDRLARGVFVGRERELERLRNAFDEAFAGRGSVVMLVGEPGIGKTRTVQELSTYARMRGAKVLWGRAHEASGAPPYWPWTQVARAYRDQTPDEIRRRQYEPYAVDLQRIFPNLRALFPNLPEPPPVDSEEAQFQLFDALSSFFRAVSIDTPLVIVLDDLHWADRSTLRMLTHLAREVGMSRLLVTGTYRDTDLDRAHPLSQALAELNREDLFTRINLRGLTETETAAYIRDTAQAEPPAELVRRVHAETEGNPFFLSEVVRLMAEEGAFSAGATSEIRIPEGVKEALGRRLDRLSPEANELLSVAAVVGRECTHALLAALTDFDDDALLGLIEEALRARVLEETGAPGEYRFTHALMQDALYSELSTARRVRMHGRVAETLEVLHASQLDREAAQLARHFGEAAVMNPALSQKAARYSRVAAEQAAPQFAWDEAIRHYERCLRLVTETPDGFGEDEAALLLGLALCEFTVGGRRLQAWEHFDRACALYRVRGSTFQYARAVATMATFAIPPDLPAHSALLEQAIAQLAGADSAELVALLALRAHSDPGPTGDASAADSAAMAARLGLSGPAYPWRVRQRAQFVAMERGRFVEAFELGPPLHEEMAAAEIDAIQPLSMASLACVLSGHIDRGMEECQRGLLYARRRRLRNAEWGLLAYTAGIAAHRGDGVGYEHAMGQIPPGANVQAAVLDAHVHMANGEATAALEAWPTAEADDAGDLVAALAHGVRACILLALDRRDAAGGEFAEWVSAWRSGVFSWVLLGTEAIASAREAMTECGDQALARELLDYLDRDPGLRSIPAGLANPDDLRGRAALSLGLDDDARRHFERGVAWAVRPDVRYLLDAGWCEQGLSDVAERSGDHALAMQHLDRAGELFQQHGGAKLYLDQVLAKKSVLRA